MKLELLREKIRKVLLWHTNEILRKAKAEGFPDEGYEIGFTARHDEIAKAIKEAETIGDLIQIFGPEAGDAAHCVAIVVEAATATPYEELGKEFTNCCLPLMPTLFANAVPCNSIEEVIEKIKEDFPNATIEATEVKLGPETDDKNDKPKLGKPKRGKPKTGPSAN
jgi:hypothetical protein